MSVQGVRPQKTPIGTMFTSGEVELSPREITEREKSNWAIAHIQVAVRPRLNKALRKAYTHHVGDLFSEANGEGVMEAYGEAISLLACLREALRLLELPVPPLPEGWGVP